MMKISVCIAILVCATSLVMAQQNAGDSALRSKLLALEYTWGQAEARGDVKALAEIFDNSLVFVDYDGKLLTKAEYLLRVKSDTAHVKQILNESMSAQLFGSVGIVFGAYSAKGVENGKPYLRRRRFIDTWVFRGETWTCVAAQATPILP